MHGVTWRDVLPFAVGWACGWLLLCRPIRLPAAAVGAPRPSVAVLVPARDEAAALPALLGSVVPQLRPGDELVVVDDGSTDGTADVAAGHGARVVTAPAPPPGWTGKTAALHHGQAVTTAPVLVFLDADVTLAPRALDRLVAAAAEPGDGVLVTVQPWHAMVRPYEQLSVPCTLLAVAGTGLGTPWGSRVHPRLAFGPVLAVRRDAYLAVGGHAHPDVRGRVTEDIGLARRFGGRVRVACGPELASMRMYPDGPASVLRGWTKSLAAGAGSTPWWTVPLTVAWVWSMLGAPFAGWPCWLVSAAQVWILGRRVGAVRWWAALLTPLLAAWFVLLLARSAWRRATGRTVGWRGRDVPAA